MKKDIWHSWRNEGIGASEAASLWNKSPYLTYEMLLTQKTTPLLVTDPSFIMKKGIRVEPLLRGKFAKFMALDKEFDPFDPAMLEYEKYPFIRASLDGLSKDKSIVAEFKFMGKEKIELKIVPDHYEIQVQHQLLVSGASKAYICATSDEIEATDMSIIEIKRRDDFIEKHVIKCLEFWNLVVEIRNEIK